MQSVGKMASLVAVLSVLAVGMMNLRLAVRDPKLADRPAREFVPALWIRVLSLAQTGAVREGWTVKEFWIGLARLGGYMRNPKQHPPGWITLWRGWKQLHPLIDYHQRVVPAESELQPKLK